MLNDLSLIDKHLVDGVEVVCGGPLLPLQAQVLTPGIDHRDMVDRFLMWIRVLRLRAVVVDNTTASVGGIELSSVCFHGLEGVGVQGCGTTHQE